MHVNLDPQLVDKIANEVKSQGVFDQFRKDSMADVDTKPAYQNLRQRVENTVNKFLSEQKWTADLNKNQLREKLRKHITEAGFLDVGVERIVDQVVNPKIATVFQPKIEDIAYKYLGIPKPEPKIEIPEAPRLNGILRIETDLMPTDLEQVSPDSDKGTVKSDCKEDMEIEDKIDDFESPPFEPIEVAINDNGKVAKNGDQEDLKSEFVEQKPSTDIPPMEEGYKIKEENTTEDIPDRAKIEASIPLKMEEEVEANISCDVTQESQLSQVSSDSRLSIVTNDNTQDEQSTTCEVEKENHVNISEEAQMPKFNENSNSGSDKKPSEPLHFDIKKDEIKFEGTERKTEPPTEAMSPNTSDEQPVHNFMDEKLVIHSNSHGIPQPAHEFAFEKENEFSFSKIEVKVEIEEATKTTSLEDSADRELHIFEKSEISQGSISHHSIESPMAKQDKLLKSPSATSSPSLPQKSSHRDKEHSTSSSRHKKRSRDRRSDRDRDKHSSSGHKASSSSSSKYHNSSKSSGSHRVSGTSSGHHHHHHHRSSSSSVHKSKHSMRNGKSSRSHHDHKDSRSRDYSKSNSDKTKEKSSKEKSDRSKPRDDHYSSKHKWRKSSDSNDDEDSSQEGTRASGLKDSRDKATNGTHYNSNTSSVTSNANNPTETVGNADTQTQANLAGQKIIILDNVLENPTTNFIEIGGTKVQVNSQLNRYSKRSYDSESLYYFETDIEEKQDVDRRVRTISKMIEDFRKISRKNVDLPRRLSIIDLEDNIEIHTENGRSRPESVSPTVSGFKRRIESPNTPPSFTSATLTIDCVPYGNSASSARISKRFKFNGVSLTKVSPTPSELSVNSKENEFIDKNAQSDSDSFGSRDNTKSVIDKVVSVKRKTNVHQNQRYSSEDLYKPRPILSQRSRRRGLDAVT